MRGLQRSLLAASSMAAVACTDSTSPGVGGLPESQPHPNATVQTSSFLTPGFSVHAEAGLFFPSCNCSFAPEVPNVVATGVERNIPLFGGISFTHHQAQAMAVYGILGASASTAPPDPTGVDFMRHRTAAGSSWHDVFLITGGSGDGVLRFVTRLHGNLSSTSHGFVTSYSNVDFYMSGDPFWGPATATHTVSSGSEDVDEEVVFSQRFVYGEPFQVTTGLDVYADGQIDVSSIANFTGTAIVTSAVVVDAFTGEPVTDAVIGTESGTDYSNLNNSPQDLLAALRALITELNLRHGDEHSLDTKLREALKELEHGKTAKACKKLDEFVKEAAKRSGKKMSEEDAALLIAKATEIKQQLSC